MRASIATKRASKPVTLAMVGFQLPALAVEAVEPRANRGVLPARAVDSVVPRAGGNVAGFPVSVAHVGEATFCPSAIPDSMRFNSAAVIGVPPAEPSSQVLGVKAKVFLQSDKEIGRGQMTSPYLLYVMH